MYEMGTCKRELHNGMGTETAAEIKNYEGERVGRVRKKPPAKWKKGSSKKKR